MARYKNPREQHPFVYTTEVRNEGTYATAIVLLVLVLFLFGLMFLLNYNTIRRLWSGQPIESPHAIQTLPSHNGQRVIAPIPYDRHYGLNNP